MATDNSITIVVPALDEERNLAGAVRTMIDAAERSFDDYEILIFNDGSTDRTGEIADELAAEHEHVFAFHHEQPKCVGGVVREGCRRARMHYLIWVDSKGATSGESLDAIFAKKGQADLVVPYATNTSERSLGRRVVSVTFRTLVNTLFGLKLRYHLHSVMCRTALAKQFTIRTNSYAYQAEALVKMIRSGASYVEVGVRDGYDDEGRCTKAFRPNNVIGVGRFLLRTLWDVYARRDLGDAEANDNQGETK